MTRLKDLGTTAKEAAKNTKKLINEIQRINKMKEEEKVETQDPRDTKCYYCHKPMGDECHYVIKSGELVMAHKNCHSRNQGQETNLRIIVKGASSCAGGSCRRR